MRSIKEILIGTMENGTEVLNKIEFARKRRPSTSNCSRKTWVPNRWLRRP